MRSHPTVLLALDKFKGCLDAADVCAELSRGILDTGLPVEVVLRPVADGGDGTLDAALAAGFHAVPVMAAGPLAQPRPARMGVRATTVLIELAEICGLSRLPAEGRRPMEATTYGVGMTIEAAIERGYADLVVGVGGSASTDGGMGAAAALGARILDNRGQPVRPCGSGLAEVASVDLDPMLALLEGVCLVVATDVDSPLTGNNGAARAFGAQKGASAEQVETLDTGLRRWAALLQEATGVDVGELPGVGAAGGFAAPFLATGTAQIASGAQLVLELTRTKQAIIGADVVVTGEGSWDAQTAAGKAPQAVLRESQAAGKPVIAVAGSFSADADLTGIFSRYSLTVAAGPGRDPLRDARILLREIGSRIIHDLGGHA